MKMKFIMMMVLMGSYSVWARECTDEEMAAAGIRNGGQTQRYVTEIQTDNGLCDPPQSSFYSPTVGGVVQPAAPSAATGGTRTPSQAGSTTSESTSTSATGPNLDEDGTPVPRSQLEYNTLSRSTMERSRGGTPEKCNKVLDMLDNARNPPPTIGANGAPVAAAAPLELTPNNYTYECDGLKKLSQNKPLESFNKTHQSMDGAIKCKKTASYTIDYEACENATRMYDGVRVAEKAMDMQQVLRTDAKNKSIQAEAAQRQAQGDLQGGALDAGIAQHKHMKAMNTEKMLAYSASVAALVNALRQFPSESRAKSACGNPQVCESVFNKYGDDILANKSQKAALVTAIAEFTAKGLAAGIAMGNNQKAADTIEKAKQPFEEEPQDLMLERCQFNPADPACLSPGQRVAGQSLGRGEFSLGDGGNNAFNLNPESGEFGEVGVETDLGDGNEVSSLGNPFADDAKRANDILNPAGAAQVQATGGAGGGSGGGAGGGLGGGGASLGSDLAGADKDGDKEAQIKAGKVSGIYGAVGGGGYRGIARSKENANPFASLFDQKGAGGGTEIEGGLAADIDGKASGLFQKISKRYNRIHADKRIEAKNLE